MSIILFMDPVQPAQTINQQQVPPPQPLEQPRVVGKGINKTLLLAGLALAAVLLAGGLFVYATFLSPKTPSLNNAGLSNSYSQKPVQKEVQNNAATDTSDTQINKDLDNIDNSLINLDSGATAVDQGFSDQAVNLQ